MAARKILSFWFKGFFKADQLDFVDSQPLKKEILGKWFGASPDHDKQIRDLFEKDIHFYAQNESELAELKKSKDGLIAAVILFDQFPRNCFRDSAMAFKFDHIALSLANEAIKNGFEKNYNEFERAFLYMPFEHSENASDQEISVAKFSELLESSRDLYKELAGMFLEFSKSHKKVIDRFGRYPHRNAVLGRESTIEELDYLENGGETFKPKK